MSTDTTRYGELCAIAQISSVIIAVGARQIYPFAARQSGDLIAFDWLLKYTANEQASTAGQLRSVCSWRTCQRTGNTSRRLPWKSGLVPHAAFVMHEYQILQ